MRLWLSSSIRARAHPWDGHRHSPHRRDGQPASSLPAAPPRVPSPTAGKQVSSTPGSTGCGSRRHRPRPRGYLGAGHCRLPSPTRWPSIPPPAARQHASLRQEGLAFPGSLPTGSGFRSPCWPPFLRRSSWVRATTDTQKHASARGPAAQGTGAVPPTAQGLWAAWLPPVPGLPPLTGCPAAKGPRAGASTAPSLSRHSATRAAPAASPHPSPRNPTSLRLPKALPTRTPPSFRRGHPNPESDSAPTPSLGLSPSPRWGNTLAPATDPACPRRQRHTRPRALCRSLSPDRGRAPAGEVSAPRAALRGPWTRGPHGHTCTPPPLSPARSQDPGQTETLLLDPPGPQGPWSLCNTPQGRTSPSRPMARGVPCRQALGSARSPFTLQARHTRPPGARDLAPSGRAPQGTLGTPEACLPQPRPTPAACPPHTTRPARTACCRAPATCHQLGARAPREAHATAPPPAPEGPPGPMGPFPLRATPWHTHASLTPAPASPRDTQQALRPPGPSHRNSRPLPPPPAPLPPQRTPSFPPAPAARHLQGWAPGRSRGNTASARAGAPHGLNAQPRVWTPSRPRELAACSHTYAPRPPRTCRGTGTQRPFTGPGPLRPAFHAPPKSLRISHTTAHATLKALPPRAPNSPPHGAVRTLAQDLGPSCPSHDRIPQPDSGAPPGATWRPTASTSLGKAAGGPGVPMPPRDSARDRHWQPCRPREGAGQGVRPRPNGHHGKAPRPASSLPTRTWGGSPAEAKTPAAHPQPTDTLCARHRGQDPVDALELVQSTTFLGKVHLGLFPTLVPGI
ncbi:basic proline-rich protein-like [Phacochoerus africanus]|uniref:basic proline-rich protein-like n=1 Tax=Phacochoerus africanus TaxID=41426 RepID=UPI001FD962D8|nr:basic proline-rich protein-like [Phacochoerus africanus]